MDGIVGWADIEGRERHLKTGDGGSRVPAVKRSPALQVLLHYRLAEGLLRTGMTGDDAGGSGVVLVVAAARWSSLIAPDPTEHREAGPRRERQNDG